MAPPRSRQRSSRTQGRGFADGRPRRTGSLFRSSRPVGHHDGVTGGSGGARRTATVTVLFCDLVGSTARQMRVGDDATDDFRRRFFTTLTDAVDRSRGEEVKNTGDGLMVVFRHSALDAVACAVSMHESVGDLDADEPIQLYVGISAGEAAEDDGDWFGTPVNEAARLCAAAKPGQTLTNEVVRSLVGSRGTFEFRAVGSLRSRDASPGCHGGGRPARPRARSSTSRTLPAMATSTRADSRSRDRRVVRRDRRRGGTSRVRRILGCAGCGTARACLSGGLRRQALLRCHRSRHLGTGTGVRNLDGARGSVEAAEPGAPFGRVACSGARASDRGARGGLRGRQSHDVASVGSRRGDPARPTRRERRVEVGSGI